MPLMLIVSGKTAREHWWSIERISPDTDGQREECPYTLVLSAKNAHLQIDKKIISVNGHSPER